jgi:hypothetical protein
MEDRPYPQAERVRRAARAAAAVDAGAIAQATEDRTQIKDKVRQARIDAIRCALD